MAPIWRKDKRPLWAEVADAQRLTPSMLRLRFTGGDLPQFGVAPFTDQYINGQFLPAEADYSVPFDQEVAKGMSDRLRPRPRRYTVRQWDEKQRILTVDFVVHGTEGFAGVWALAAEPGDRLQFSGPGGGYRPDDSVAWHLMAGDESALPAIAASLESLRPGSRAKVLIVVDSAQDETPLESAGEVEVTWLHRRGSADSASLLPAAVADATFLNGDFDVFVHGEAGEVREVRRHLLTDRGVDKASASISPYWKRFYTDEKWRAIKKDWLAEQAADV